MHRQNVIGAIEPIHRDEGLRGLQTILRTIRRRWPDVLFLSAPELGYVVEHNLSSAAEIVLGPPSTTGLPDGPNANCPRMPGR